MRLKYVSLIAASMLGLTAAAEQWFSVTTPAAEATGTGVEVDLHSIHAREPGGEGVIRVTHESPRPHSTDFRYRSFVASARFDCRRRTLSLVSAAYFAGANGTGARLGVDDPGSPGDPSALLDSIPASAQRALVRATCATVQTSAA